jgi:hypothetical protein
MALTPTVDVVWRRVKQRLMCGVTMMAPESRDSGTTKESRL